jgi:glycosyltransferase involved in cell wall biosynthesis
MVVSKTLQNHYRTHYKTEPVYIPNGAAIRQRSLPTRLPQWGLEPNRYALFLGRFSPEKNCHLLISAFEMLDTAYKLVLAGGSSHTDAYAAELQRHQSQNITLLDWVSGDALNELLTNAALFVLPSDLEGLSLALLDAMGAGICVLTSDIPENREVVDSAGFSFRARDVDDLARMLGLLLSDPDIRAAAGRSAQRLIQQRYLWPQIARQIAELYDGVLNGWDTVTPELPPRTTLQRLVRGQPQLFQRPANLNGPRLPQQIHDHQ